MFIIFTCYFFKVIFNFIIQLFGQRLCTQNQFEGFCLIHSSKVLLILHIAFELWSNFSVFCFLISCESAPILPYNTFLSTVWPLTPATFPSVLNKKNKSTQRVYNPFEKRSNTISLHPHPPHLFLPSSSFSYKLSFLSIREKERILPCLIAPCIGVYSRPVHPLSTLPSHFTLPPFSFPSVSYVVSEFGGNFLQRTYAECSM